jgi:acetoacetyl-CoA synthetase
MPPAQQQVKEKLTAAMAAYQPQPYHGGAIVFVRAALRLGEYFDPIPLWRRIGRGGLMIVEIPDGHLDMVGRNAPLVAAALERALMDVAAPDPVLQDAAPASLS